MFLRKETRFDFRFLQTIIAVLHLQYCHQPFCLPHSSLFLSLSPRQGSVPLRERRSTAGQSHRGKRLHRFHCRKSALRPGFSDHRWNRPLRLGIRQHNVEHGGGASRGERLEHPRLVHRHGKYYGRRAQSRISTGTAINARSEPCSLYRSANIPIRALWRNVSNTYT